MRRLLAGQPRVVNVGLSGFARDLAANGIPVVHVDWRPPSRLQGVLTRLEARAAQIDEANAETLRRMLAADPVLVGVRRAGELIPELDADQLILHAGPPLTWERMCGPLRGAICGAIVFEGWARDLDDAAWKALSAHYDERRLIEIVLLTNQYEGLASTITALRIQTDH